MGSLGRDERDVERTGHDEDAADRLLESRNPKRRALGKVVANVAKAMHDIEWVDSCDYGMGREIAAIDAVIGTRGEMETLVSEAMEKAEKGATKP